MKFFDTKKVELSDILILIGLGGIGVGVWEIAGAVSLIVVGALLFAMGLFRYLRA